MPKLNLLDLSVLQQLTDEAFALLRSHGVRVGSAAALDLLRSAGAGASGDIVRLPERLVRRALDTAPRSFALYDRAGNQAVNYTGDNVHFDPGSSSLRVLDPATLRIRLAVRADLERTVRVTEMLDEYAAQSTAVVCSEVPAAVSDLYRLYVLLLHSRKPIVTGAFSIPSTHAMVRLLSIDAGGAGALAARPRAVFDVCPSPPMHWTEFAADSVLVLGRSGVPVEIISMPLAGATGPVTLLGVVAQHAAETLAGITMHQLAAPGAPVVWGGAATIMDMRTGLAPIGAIETAMLAAGCAQVGKQFSLPTHAYLVATDAKLVDAQAGLESGMSALLGALAGINMISGAGMLDSLAAFSVEKLVLDSEAIGMIRRLSAGMVQHGDTLATRSFDLATPSTEGFAGHFLELDETRRLHRAEHHRPSAVIERRSVEAWEAEGRSEAFQRARTRALELEGRYEQPQCDPLTLRAMRELMAAAGLETA